MKKKQDHYGKGPRNWQRSDKKILENVCEILTQDNQLDASQIEVSVSEGLVTLKGGVENRQQKHLAEDLADSIPGVRDVHNHITVHKKVDGFIKGISNAESDDKDQGLGMTKSMY